MTASPDTLSQPSQPSYQAPWGLRSGLAMTVYTALRLSQRWEHYTQETAPSYQDHIFTGAQSVPIFGQYSLPPIAQPDQKTKSKIKGTIVATYGITGNLDNQWFLKILRRKAIDRNYAVVLFDWRAHGKTAQLSPVLTSDGLFEGQDFVEIAKQAKALGCPPPYWFMGYSLGGQLALWGIKAGQDDPDFAPDFAGGAVICPSLDSERSLTTLVSTPIGRYLERVITKQLRTLAHELLAYHPTEFDPAAIDRAKSIWTFDEQLVIGRLGFATVSDYYTASNALTILPHLTKPTQILYAADDPLFDPAIIPELQAIAHKNAALHLQLTAQGGHVGYLSNKACQRAFGDRDPWWAWNRILENCDAAIPPKQPELVELR